MFPTADTPIDFTLTGPARILGLGNGDPSDHAPHASQTRLFNGLCQLLLQAGTAAGRIVLTAQGERLASGTLKISCTK